MDLKRIDQGNQANGAADTGKEKGKREQSPVFSGHGISFWKRAFMNPAVASTRAGKKHQLSLYRETPCGKRAKRRKT